MQRAVMSLGAVLIAQESSGAMSVMQTDADSAGSSAEPWSGSNSTGEQRDIEADGAAGGLEFDCKRHENCSVEPRSGGNSTESVKDDARGGCCTCCIPRLDGQ